MARSLMADFQGRIVRLTDERCHHILEHPEMAGLERSIEETLGNPATVVESLSDSQVRLYYRPYYGTRVGDKFLCVVVKLADTDAFVITAYLTDQLKHGRQIWRRQV